MKIHFPKLSNSQIIAQLTKTMEGRSIGDLVKLEEESGNLVVKISKLGTSTLTFTRKEAGDQVEFNLTSEKIAMAHKAFKGEVTDKLVGVIERSGGKVSRS